MSDEYNLMDSSMPKQPEPYWRDSANVERYPALENDLEVDVAIIGGGISGITTAYRLALEGVKVALLEADVLLNGTTGHTTAKVTAQHGAIYHELITHFGEEKAQHYYDAQTEALTFIEQLVQEENIDCDFSKEDAYLYTTTNRGQSKLQDEYAAYQKLGIRGELLDSVPLNNVPVKSALVMRNQAQFHPLKYLAHLVKKFVEHGGQIFEHTVATDIKDGDKPIVLTQNGPKIKAGSVVVASHFPFYDGGGLYFSRMYVERSYVLAAKVPERECPDGMYLSIDSPSRSLRYTMRDGQKLAIIGGEEHKTGQGINTSYHYEALEQYGMELFSDVSIEYRWSAQDTVTLDKVPYIGRISRMHHNIFVATGYRKWGMTNGTMAGLLLTDLILKRNNRYESLYRPSRFIADPSVKKFLSHNTDVAKQLLKGKFDQNERHPEDVGKDEAAIVSVNGKRAGAYRTTEGELHVVDTTCTHMGCEVHWNEGDRSWDCPCHGSRFAPCGDVLEGPAKKPLRKV
ncbi:FAD-dependent oxidoreductase [Halalkalibacter krulwichiae]|uniref:Gamma-glutamylputrescine oxidoreductase n=1 Tax=Halalkalibacter krulwichiae TaxID=199441 RepID=A0A1X9MLN3_9BACI|nr:FAD-dependent oxidoreductase [Halalkalibacter krulwichiae]ARK32831.1 Gamma-glutamylputrescine oxidoreductase [Halalkalibacter krulwichiae]